MNSSRWTRVSAVLAAGIVLAGVGVGAVAHLAGGGASARMGPPGPSLAFVPQGASLIGYVDLKSLASSPLAASWSDDVRERTPLAALDEFRASTGVDILNDVDALTFAVGPGPEKPARWGIAASGVFDRGSLLEKLSQHEGGVETSTYGGTEIQVVKRATESTAMALPDDATLLVGDAAYVREMLDAGSGQKPSASGSLESWGYGSFEGEAFWLVGSAPEFVNGFVGRGTDKASLRTFAVTGRLDTDLLLRARGKANDAKTAQELANVVRGFVALGRLRSDPSRESALLDKMAQSVSVELTEEVIDVNLMVPYDSIRELLSSQRKAANAP
jgi:hypothetical protein